MRMNNIEIKLIANNVSVYNQSVCNQFSVSNCGLVYLQDLIENNCYKKCCFHLHKYYYKSVDYHSCVKILRSCISCKISYKLTIPYHSI